MATEQTPIDKAIAALMYAYDTHNYYGQHGRADEAREAGEALEALRAMPTKEQTPVDKAIAALERLDGYATLDEMPRHYGDTVHEALAALRSMPTPESAEPVLWMNTRNGKTISANAKAQMEGCKHPLGIYYTIPLYTHPPKPESAEPVLSVDQAIEAMRVWLSDENDTPKGQTLTKGEEENLRFRLNAFAAHPPKPEQPRVVLTDEVIDSYARAYTHPYSTEVARALRYVRDNGYLAPAKEERVVLTEEDPFKAVEVPGTDRWKVVASNVYSLNGLNKTNAIWQAEKMNWAYRLGLNNAPAPFPVDEVMEVVNEWSNAKHQCPACNGTGSPQELDRFHCRGCGGSGSYGEEFTNLRTRLMAKFGTP